MNCDQALLLMQNETLTVEEQEALLAHLESCPECKNIYELTRLTDEAVASLAVEPPEHLVSDTMWKIAPEYMEKKTGRKHRRRFPFAGTAIAAVAAAALLVVGLNQVNKTPQVESAQETNYAFCVENAEDTVDTTARTFTTAADEPGFYAPEADMGSCLAVMHGSDAAEEIGGEMIAGEMAVDDARAWMSLTFAVPEGKLSGVRAGAAVVKLMNISREKLDALKADFPERVEIVEADGEWNVCTLVVMEESK